MERSKVGISRRDFLRTSGAASAAGLLAEGMAEAAPGEAAAMALGPAPVPVRLSINRQAQRLKVAPHATLLSVLRDQLGLCGTKLGCDRGACGACTVWIDGVPAPACMTLALDVAALLPRDTPPAVTTIEGLSRGDKLHPVQAAFIEHDALQCGFCTPGMIMSCAALCEERWRSQKAPDAAAVAGAVSGNLCRCGAYPNILSATLAAYGKGRRTP